MKIATMVQVALVFGFSGCALSALAQAPVSDVSTSRPRVEVNEGYDTGSRTYGTESAVRSSAGNTSTGAINASDGGAMFRQFQQLQEEVATLRGQLEEQSYELQKLKQQHQEDFANLNSRLAGGNAPSHPAAVNTSNAAGQVAAPAINTAGNSDGREEYEAAYGLLKAKDYAGASTAFKAFVSKYPESDYAGNSWFWLGFVHQTQGDIDSASKSFSSLIERFPHHSKVDDAKYNLGKIYNQQGKADQARTLLKEVAAGSSKSAPLAKSYLESM